MDNNDKFYDLYDSENKFSSFHPFGIKKRWIVLGLIGVLVVTFFICNYNVILSLSSIKRINEKIPVYSIDIRCDVYFDEYMKQGSESAEDLIAFLSEKITHGLINPSDLQHGCSGFFAKNEEGDYLLCQNLDTPAIHVPTVTTTKIDGTNVLGISSMGQAIKSREEFNFMEKVSFMAAPYLMSSGMNEYGLAITIATAGGSSSDHEENLSVFDLTVPMVVLNNAKNVPEALEVLSNLNVVNDRFELSHYCIADKDGACVLVEWGYDKQMKVIDSNGEAFAFANFLMNDNPECVGNGSDRYKRYMKRLTQNAGIISEKEAMELLHQNTLSNAMYSVVFNLSKGTMYVTFAGDYESEYFYDIKIEIFSNNHK